MELKELQKVAIQVGLIDSADDLILIDGRNNYQTYAIKDEYADLKITFTVHCDDIQTVNVIDHCAFAVVWFATAWCEFLGNVNKEEK